MEVSLRRRIWRGCGTARILGEVDPPEYVDFLTAVQGYNPRSRRIMPSCMTRLIDQFKIDDWNFNSFYAYPIAMAMALLVKAYKEKIGAVDIITYVPSHPSELRRDKRSGEHRDHIKFLATLFQVFLSEFSCPVKSLLRKVEAVKMKNKTKEERFKLAERIYVLSKSSPSNIYGKRILLIDDITTSGATLRACAKVLKEAGAERVVAVVACKTK